MYTNAYTTSRCVQVVRLILLKPRLAAFTQAQVTFLLAVFNKLHMSANIGILLIMALIMCR